MSDDIQELRSLVADFAKLGSRVGGHYLLLAQTLDDLELKKHLPAELYDRFTRVMTTLYLSNEKIIQDATSVERRAKALGIPVKGM